MKGPFEAVKISDHVHWVGAIDWSLRDFHGYATMRGTTYNAYLVMADRITLIDTVKAPFVSEMLSRIASVVDPREIATIVSNHAEMDHSGGLPEVVRTVKPDKVLASRKGVENLALHFALDANVSAVADGQSLSLGNLNLTFMETPMLHWPESMVTYLAEDQVLFSQDAFGMHLASSERFDDELDPAVVESEAARYYANILLPFSNLITKAVEKVGGLRGSIRLIAPDHGPIWRRDIDKILGLYGTWAAQKPTKKAVVVWDTMWESTTKMARAIAEGLTAGGAQPKLLQLRRSNRSDIVTEVLDAGALLVGSPTVNAEMFPTVADILTYLKGLKPRNLVGAAFGSYGWVGKAVGQINEALRAMQVELVSDGVEVKFVPDAAALDPCRTLGLQVAQRIT